MAKIIDIKDILEKKRLNQKADTIKLTKEQRIAAREHLLTDDDTYLYLYEENDSKTEELKEM